MGNLLSKQERALITQISDNSSKDEIIKYYTFNEKDMIEIRKHRGAYNRIGFATQIGVLRHKGWTLSNINEVPNQILEYIGTQIDIFPKEFITYFNRRNTIFAHQKEIRDTFGYALFDKKIHSQILENLMDKYLSKSNDPFYLISMLIKELKSIKIILPGITILEDLIAKIILKTEENAIIEINNQINDKQRKILDDLLESTELDKPPVLTWLRNTSGKSTPNELIELVKRIEKIETLELKIVITKVPNYIVNQYIKLGQRYDPYSLRRFNTQKKYAILVLFLKDLYQDLIDKVITIHDLKIVSVFSSIRKKQDKKLKEYKIMSKNAIDDYIEIGETLSNSNITIEKFTNDVLLKLTIKNEKWIKFQDSLEAAKKLSEKNKIDSIEMMGSYYNTFRKYTPTLLKALTFNSINTPCKKLVDAVNIIKELNDSKKVNLPNEVDLNFTNKKWRSIVNKKTGSAKRHYFELAVLNELRNKIRSGDIYISESKNYKNIEDYLISKEKWESEKTNTRLSASLSFDEYFKSTEKRLDSLMKLYSKNSEKVNDIIGEDNKLHPKRVEKSTPEEAKKLSRNLYNLIPKITLQDLLLEISSITGFEKHFPNLANNKDIDSKKDLTTLIFAIMGIGTNVGLSNIAASLKNISYKQLAYTADWRLIEENLYKALNSMVNLQMKEPIAKWWGDGTTSSSDGMRLLTIVDALNASYNPHFGFEKGLTIYRFINDKYAAFYSIVTNTNVRDALHVIDGILKYASEIKIQEHYTDTAGYTDQIFALMSLMGFRFAPRLRNLPDLKLYAFDRNKYPKLKDLITGTINKELIRENYDSIMRLAHSIYEEKVSSAVILGKLGSYARKNSVANALKEMGKIEKTIFILEYTLDLDLRKRIQCGLNKGEAMNNLARNVFFGKKGNMWEHELQAQFQTSSCLNILLDSIVLWNTKYLLKAWKHYKNENPNADETLLKHVSPLNWEHINFLGNYSFDFETKYEEDNLRELNIQRS